MVQMLWFLFCRVGICQRVCLYKFYFFQRKDIRVSGRSGIIVENDMEGERRLWKCR